MLEGLFKGLVLWLYSLILDGVHAMANALLDVFNMDMSYFEQYAPVTVEIVQIIVAAGWALLIGNMAFQAMRSMAAGIGFEGEDPKILFTRTFVFGFLLLASRQICGIGLSITATVMDLMRIPDSVVINTPDESMLGPFDAAWIWMVIIGIILIWQIVKFFFEIGERYVVLAVLTFMAPLAFGMGGSKSTEDIFKGWSRMYGSMCVMMLMNVVFLKLLLSAMSTVPSGLGLIPWLIFVVAIARVGRKMDDLVCRVGLNPARTGDPLGRGLPVMVSMMVAKGLGKTLAGTFVANKQNPKPAGGASGASASPRSGPTGPAGSPGGSGVGSAGGRSTGGTYSGGGTATAQQAAASAAMGGAAAAVGQAAGAATSAAGQSMGHSPGQSTGAQRQPSAQTPRQESPAQGTQGQATKRPGNPVSPAPARPPRTRPVNIDVEYKVNDREAVREGPLGGDEPDAHSGGSVTPPHTAQKPSAPPTAAKAAEQSPTRPPIQRTPRGNFPQPPVGAGVTPHMSHSTSQSSSSTSSSSQSQTPQAAASPARPAAPRDSAPAGVTTVQGTNVTNNSSVQKPAGQPLQGARSTSVGIDRGTTPTAATRPPIGHNAAAKPASQESHPVSPGRNSTPLVAPAPQGTPPSPSRNAAPAGAASPGRDTATHSVSSVAQTPPPSPGRNGASAPQKPLSPALSTDRGTSSAPSPGRNSAPQGAPPSPGRNDAPPKRPPVGHNRKPPQGS